MIKLNLSVGQKHPPDIKLSVEMMTRGLICHGAKV